MLLGLKCWQQPTSSMFPCHSSVRRAPSTVDHSSSSALHLICELVFTVAVALVLAIRLPGKPKLRGMIESTDESMLSLRSPHLMLMFKSYQGEPDKDAQKLNLNVAVWY
ncbi:hypothetical protein V3C99_005436 [Haemonchus contortus]